MKLNLLIQRRGNIVLDKQGRSIVSPLGLLHMDFWESPWGLPADNPSRRQVGCLQHEMLLGPEGAPANTIDFLVSALR